MSLRTASLQIHPGQSCTAVRGIDVRVTRVPDGGLCLIWRILGQIDSVAIPPAASGIADGLWQHTCCEAFVGTAGATAYQEFNFSPSGQWAHYAFSAYRARRVDAANGPAPAITVLRSPDCLELEARIDAGYLPALSSGQALQIGLTAVVEAVGGSRTHWALAHRAPEPDFHQRSTFLLELT